jgi:hypothetical protein
MSFGVDAADSGDALAKRFACAFDEFDIRLENVELIQNDDFWLVKQVFVEEPEFAADDRVTADEFFDRVIEAVLAFGGRVFQEFRSVEKVDENSSSFDVLQEFMSKPASGVRAFDQAG